MNALQIQVIIALASLVVSKAALAQPTANSTTKPMTIASTPTSATSVPAAPKVPLQTAAAQGNVAPGNTSIQKPTNNLKAKVIEAKGTVESAPNGSDPLDVNAWKPVKVGDLIGDDVMIRTGLRSRCILMFGEAPDQTIISIRRATLARISEFVKTSTEQRIRLGLGYGAIRGGSSEGTLRSDVVIDSTVATLAKRGTEGFELEVEPTTGRFNISLSQSGLVEALSKLNNQRRSVHPGEYATNENIAKMWVSQDIFNRSVRFYESEALSKSDLGFLSKETTGLSNLGPAGRSLFGAGGRNPGAILNIVRNRNPRANRQTIMLIRDGAVPRPEGSFGFGPTFRVLTPRFERRTSINSLRNVRPRPRVQRTLPRRPSGITRRRSSSTR